VARKPARDRIVSSGDDGLKGLLFCLKPARCRQETAKQAELRLAILPKILRIAPAKARGVHKGSVMGCSDGNFVRDMANSSKIACFVI